MVATLVIVGVLILLAGRLGVVVHTGLSEASLRGEFFQRYESTVTYWRDLTTRITSTSDEEKHRWLGTVPQLREWGSGRLAKGLRAESYDVKNMKYEATLEVDRDEIEDDQLQQIKMRVNELAVRAADHKDYLVEQLLINGATAGFHGYDGVPFFGATHEEGESGAQDNDLAPTAVDADVPTPTEFRLALTQAIAQMIGFKDDRGQPMRIKPSGFTCVVPPTMLFPAMEAISASLIGVNAWGPQGNVIREAAQVIAMPGLSPATTWFLLKTDVPVRPFIFQDRMPIEFTALESNSETGFTRDKFLYGVRARYRIAYGYWQYAIRNVFTQ